jgi:hypothetical protein
VGQDIEGVGGDRCASGSTSTHRFWSSHLIPIHTSVLEKPHGDNRVVIMPCGDG